MNLWEWMERERSARGWSRREVARRAEISRGPLDNLKKNPSAVPELDTLRGLAKAFDTPLWRVVDIATGDNAETGSTTPDIDRAAALVRSMPELADLVLRAMNLPKDDRIGVLSYLEVVDRRRSEIAASQEDEDDDQ